MQTRKLPRWFDPPFEFRYMIENGIVNLGTWSLIVDETRQSDYYALLKKKLPDREIVPLAQRFRDDMCACLELGKGEEIQLIDAFIGDGLENCGAVESYSDWVRYAFEDFLEFVAEEKDYHVRTGRS